MKGVAVTAAGGVKKCLKTLYEKDGGRRAGGAGGGWLSWRGSAIHRRKRNASGVECRKKSGIWRDGRKRPASGSAGRKAAALAAAMFSPFALLATRSGGRRDIGGMFICLRSHCSKRCVFYAAARAPARHGWDGCAQSACRHSRRYRVRCCACAASWVIDRRNAHISFCVARPVAAALRAAARSRDRHNGRNNAPGGGCRRAARWACARCTRAAAACAACRCCVSTDRSDLRVAFSR